MARSDHFEFRKTLPVLIRVDLNLLLRSKKIRNVVNKLLLYFISAKYIDFIKLTVLSRNFNIYTQV